MSVKVGFIGVGGISRVHLEYLAKSQDAKIVAVSDIAEEKARQVGATYGASAYVNYEEMLDKEDLDAVYISLPPFAHGKPELKAAEHGLHLFIEKPIATNIDTAKEILKVIAEKRLISSVGYQWRYLDTVGKARELLSGRTVGMVLGYWMGGLPGVAWWRVMEQSGGQFVEQTTHIVDLARYIAGNVKRVFASYALRSLQDVPNLNVPDVGTVTLEFENGAIGTISNTCMLSQGYNVGLNVVTRDLVLEMTGSSLKRIEPYHTEEFRTRVNPYNLEDQSFIDAVKTGDTSKIRSTYADAFETHRVTMAANESARLGKPVDLIE